MLRTACLLALVVQPAAAALPIELEVAVERGSPVDAMQTWSRRLSQMDLTRARLRGARARDEPSITTEQLGNRTRYRVVGLLTRTNRLQLPGGTFGLSDEKRLRQYFADLPLRTDHEAVERGRFGLTEAQFKEVFRALSQPVGVAGEPMRSADSFERLAEQLTIPVAIDSRQLAKLRAAQKPTAGELRLSTGAAMALWLRRAGLMFVPEQLPGGPLQLRVTTYNASKTHWPPGWKPASTPRQAAPKLYQFRTIEIDGYTLNEAVAALEKFIEIPIVWDEWILARNQKARNEIDRNEDDRRTTQVRLARQKIYLRAAIDRILGQVRLAGEVRVDETGQAFYWVTQFGSESPRAID